MQARLGSMGEMFNEDRIEHTDLTEFNKLEELLRKNEIPFEREDEIGFMDFHQLRSIEMIGEKYVWDVICHFGSYGHEKGLLEIWGENMDEPEGFLSAEECLEKIKERI